MDRHEANLRALHERRMHELEVAQSRRVPDCICSPSEYAGASEDCPRCRGVEPPQHPAARY